MTDFNQDPWDWVKDRFLDQNQVGRDVNNSGGILGPVDNGAVAQVSGDGTTQSYNANLFDTGSIQNQTGITDLPDQTIAQPHAWSGDHGRTVYISRPDHSLEIRTGGTLGWRNNNPGNLRSGQAEIGQNDSQSGRLAIFGNPDAGTAAQSNLIFGPKYQNLSIADAIRQYAPPSENNTDAYVSDMERRTGLDRGTILNTLNGAQRADFLNAIRAHEGFRPGTSGIAYYNPFGHWGN